MVSEMDGSAGLEGALESLGGVLRMGEVIGGEWRVM